MAAYGITHPRVGRLRRLEALIVAATVAASLAVGFGAGRVTAPSGTIAARAPEMTSVSRAPAWRYELNRAINVQLLAPFDVETPAWRRHLNDAMNVVLGHEATR